MLFFLFPLGDTTQQITSPMLTQFIKMTLLAFTKIDEALLCSTQSNGRCVFEYIDVCLIVLFWIDLVLISLGSSLTDFVFGFVILKVQSHLTDSIQTQWIKVSVKNDQHFFLSSTALFFLLQPLALFYFPSLYKSFLPFYS